MIRPLLFSTSSHDPEYAHEKALALLLSIGKSRWLSERVARYATTRDQRLQQRLWELYFHSPVGLAAGFDKNGIALQGLASLGFSHIEMGTITPLPQKGNPRPRMFRFAKDQALINRMGFNNNGVESVQQHLKSSRLIADIPLGISLGKGKDTPPEKAPEDYLAVLNSLKQYGDYFVVNVSSPNTKGLRALQDKEHLTEILAGLQENLSGKKPLLVKIAPDLEWGKIDELIEVCVAWKVGGIIATNTTIARTGLRVETTETGGMSGEPLYPRALEVVQYLRRHVPRDYPIIGVGGIMNGVDAYQMLLAGANLLQVYTGFVYAGPFFMRELNRSILAFMKRDGFTCMADLHSGG